MIDIHTHILPNLDDGADSMEEAIAMAELAADSGTRGIVASSHGNLGGYTLYEYFKVFQKFRQKLKEEHISLEVYPGMEVFMDEHAVGLLKDEELLTLNGTRYVLVEFDFREELWMADEYLQNLKDEGFIPVVAHPERYVCVQNNPQAAYEWVTRGCILQGNKGSLLGVFGRGVQETSRSLLRHHLFHMLASDAHGSQRRTPAMGDIQRFLEEAVSEEYKDMLLWRNASRILSGRESLLPPPVPYR